MKLKLLDTGYVSAKVAPDSDKQLSDANRAGYTGSAVTSFTLLTTSVARSRDVKIENKPVISNYTNPDSTLVSTGSEVLSVNMAIQKRITTSGYDDNDIVQFLRMDRTRGLKLIYPSVVTDTNKNIVEALGAVNLAGNFSNVSPADDDGTVATTTPYLVGRVRNITVTDTAKGDYWKISFNFVVVDE